MPRIKIARKSTAIDMTAMCDVAFLLLTFFILTATARQPEPLSVDTPSSVTIEKQPDMDVATIVIGHNKVFFKMAGQHVRKVLLAKMGAIYNLQFTPEEQYQFSLIETFGVPIGSMKQFLAMDPTVRAKQIQPGIGIDSVGDNPSELFNWLYQAQNATKEVNNKVLLVSLKGDSQEEYPIIKKIVAIMQEQNINKFSLITELEANKK